MADKRDPVQVLEQAKQIATGLIAEATRALATFAEAQPSQWANIRQPLIARLSQLITEIDRAKTRVQGANGLIADITRLRRQMFDLRQDLRKAGDAGKKPKHQGKDQHAARGRGDRGYGGPRRGGPRW